MFNWKKIFKKRINPKDIPVLEDIIEDDDEFVDKGELIEDYPHLFSNEDGKEEEASSENDEFVIDLSDEINGESNNQTDIPESNVPDVNDAEMDDIETDETKADSSDIEKDNNDITETEDENIEVNDNEVTDAKTTNSNIDLTDPAQLDLIVNKVVEQLMPELKQQLHSLVEKTLTEKSPEELANLLNTDDSHSSDKS